jgi:UTP--glucose-1-phosphate uridylyltransferase
MKQITKAVIPAAGFGTRMLPAAKSVPKELLPVIDRPVIQYVVEEAAAGGVTDVILVSNPEKRAVEQHFQPSPSLENRLKQTGKQQLLASIEQLMSKIRISAVDQLEQRGLGHAVLQAKSRIGNEPFICLLGDTIFSGDPLPVRQLQDAYQKFGTAIIGLEQVAPEKVDRYGIVGGETVADGVLKLTTLVEKPPRDQAPSNYAIAARYLLTPTIFECLEQTPPGKGGEIQLTDALKLLLTREPIHGVVLTARRHDIGNPLDWLRTNLLFAKRDAVLWKQLEQLL